MNEYMGFSDDNQRDAVRMFVLAAKIFKFPAELVQNGIEHNASEVEFTACKLDGVRKLVIRNNGYGMTPDEMDSHLMKMCSSSKVTSTDGNRGMGARITGLKASPAGLIYSSAKAGERITEVRLADDGIGIVTSKRTLRKKAKEDFVQVIVIGQTAESDTVAVPYAGCDSVRQIGQDLINTYFRFPEGFGVRFGKGLKMKHPGILYPVWHKWSEAITTTYSDCGNIAFHWVDADQTRCKAVKAKNMHVIGGVIQNIGQRNGLVYQNRLFDLKLNLHDWRHHSQAFGLELVSESIMLFVELLEGYPVAPNTNRDALDYHAAVNGRRISDTVEFKDFGKLSRDHRPAWVQKRVDEARNSLLDPPDVEDQMREIAKLFGLMETKKKLDEDGDDTAPETPDIEHDEDENEPDPNPNPFKKNEDGTRPATSLDALLRNAPEFRLVFNEQADVCEGKTMSVGFNDSRPVGYINGHGQIVSKFCERVAACCTCTPEDAAFRAGVSNQISVLVATPYWMSVLVPHYLQHKSVDLFVEYMTDQDHHGMATVMTSLMLKEASIKSIAREVSKVLGKTDEKAIEASDNVTNMESN